ncbi:MAG TPA: hypothetical protein DHW22_05075, partial [Planctomycetaceae bacterium]|nr:hypothetical protein [Planctomycetaceae bacterium]
STFGAGSLACAAGLATLQDRQVAENTAARSQQLFRGLEKIASQNKRIISEIRGQGLMIGIELKPFGPLIAAHWSSSDKSGATQYLMPQWQDTIDALPTIYLMNTLLDQHGIYTQVARSNPRVLRVQPPLVVSQGEVDHFLRSLETTISEMQPAPTWPKRCSPIRTWGFTKRQKRRRSPTRQLRPPQRNLLDCRTSGSISTPNDTAPCSSTQRGSPLPESARQNLHLKFVERAPFLPPGVYSSKPLCNISRLVAGSGDNYLPAKMLCTFCLTWLASP